MGSAFAFPPPVKTVVVPAVLTLTAVSVAAVVCLEKPLLPGMVALGLFVFLLAFSRLRLAGIVVAYIAADHLCQFLKRAVFLLPDQSLPSYYALQILPTLVMAVAFASAIRSLKTVRFSAASYCMAIFALISVLTTLVSPAGVTWSARMGGFNQSVVPMAAFFVGMAVPARGWPGIAKIFLILILISVPFGIYQLLTGPTLIDRAWADATYTYSVEGWKVWAFTHKVWTDFRAYSYYADHLTWGLFLANATIFVVACESMKIIPKSWRFLALAVGTIGILTCETRSVWITFAGTFIVYRIISVRGLRRPLLVLALVGASFAGVVWLGLYARQHVNIPSTSNRIIDRALVVGTIAARTSAPEIYLSVLPGNLLYGGGFGASYLSHALDDRLKFSADQFSHNLLVDLVTTLGLPGEIAFFCFVYFWIKDAFWLIKVSEPREARAIRWLVAIFVGLLLSSGISTVTFLNSYFYLLSGLMCAEWSRKKLAYRNIPASFGSPHPWQGSLEEESLSPAS